MFYEIENQPKKISSEMLDAAVTFACDYLDLDIDLLIEFETLKKHQCGFCDYDPDSGDVTVTIAKRLSLKDILRTLFHELVHVKQYVDGRLEAGSPCRWYGDVYDVEYHQLPWEIEAFELEAKMMVDYGSA